MGDAAVVATVVKTTVVTHASAVTAVILIQRTKSAAVAIALVTAAKMLMDAAVVATVVKTTVVTHVTAVIAAIPKLSYSVVIARRLDAAIARRRKLNAIAVDAATLKLQAKSAVVASAMMTANAVKKPLDAVVVANVAE